ncbi:MAG: hypothetical protein IAB75_00950 [Bacteroidetes bacterium]|uniref:Lipoprotein n=1 Tax=Candidatus Cryptobacteroides avicola TaxID=2840757 RepID=A0A940IHE3_9BACT|nr:hypothetical protein [Candidatus Cryptobacteroides avicola]
MTIRKKTILMAVFATAIAGCRTDGGEDTGTEAILARLDRTVAERELYIQKKESRIEGMKSVLNSGMTDEERYRVYDRIYDEYYQYNMDSAIVYAKKKFNLASGITPPIKRTPHWTLPKDTSCQVPMLMPSGFLTALTRPRWTKNT